MYVHVHVCTLASNSSDIIDTCNRERERGKEGGKEAEKERERKREREGFQECM